MPDLEALYPALDELRDAFLAAARSALAVFCDHLAPIDGGKARCRADRPAADLPATAWARRSAGDGSKGPRFYDWAWLTGVGADGDPDDDGRHSLLIRRNNTTGEPAFYRC